MKKWLKKYKAFILYGFFGVLTTLINIIIYWLFSHLLSLGIMFSTIIAWILAVLFAYVTNRKWVFNSKATMQIEIIKEICSFFACRLFTGIIDWLCMYIFVGLLHMNDMTVKAVANILVIILNYVASRFIFNL